MLVNSHSICSLRERDGFFHAANKGAGGPPRHIIFVGACDGENIIVEDNITLRSNTSLREAHIFLLIFFPVSCII